MSNVFIPRFIGSLDSVEKADIVVAGFPYDCTSSFRAGSRFAPREIRSYSFEAIEDFSFYFGRGLDEIKFFDAGDMDVMVGNPSLMTEEIRKTALELMENGKKLLGIGGEHLVTYPLFQAHQELYGNFTILHLDAHADLREGYAGDSLSHASVMNLCLQEGLEKLIQFGIRSGTREEYNMRQTDERIIPAESIEEIADAIEVGEKIYISLDVDFFDSGLFPGTGTPETGGHTFLEYIRILKVLREKRCNIIGADILEFFPEVDPSKCSTVFAAKLVRETLLAIGLQ